jgi:hypothetical protein
MKRGLRGASDTRWVPAARCSRSEPDSKVTQRPCVKGPADLVKRRQIAVGERRQENVFLQIVAALVEVEHDALQLQVHIEDARGHEAADAEAVFFAFGESSALEKKR